LKVTEFTEFVMHLNAAALELARPLVENPAAYAAGIEVRGGVRVADCGVARRGGTDAGILMARVAMAGLGQVRVVSPAAASTDLSGRWSDCPWPMVVVASDHPVTACLAAQYAGWKVKGERFFAMASGPLRAAIAREPIFETIGHVERPDSAVGLLEAATLPPPDVCRQLASDAGVAPERLLLLVARTASTAGTLQVVARSLETALHKLHDLGFDLERILRGRGEAPLPPVPGEGLAGSADDLVAIGRTNDAILYGGSVVLEVRGDDASLQELGPRMVSSGSPSHGRGFLELFEGAGRDFYALDPALFAPATIELVNLDTGRTHRFGRLDPDLVRRSFTSPASGN
jgi:methenyltetrahydromethanopterin cyclohydrolase